MAGKAAEQLIVRHSPAQLFAVHRTTAEGPEQLAPGHKLLPEHTAALCCSKLHIHPDKVRASFVPTAFLLLLLALEDILAFQVV